MKIKNHIKSYSISWLANTYDRETSTGEIENYYLPETMEEFVDLCRDLQKKKEAFKIVGATSNVYIKPNSSFKHVISIRHLNQFYQDGEVEICQCGVSVKQLVRKMISDGIDGYACMIDLPGTIGGAIYGNAGVSRHSIVQQLVDVTLLLNDGTIQTFAPEELGFSFRSSKLKRGEMDGVILSCRLKRYKGNKSEIEEEARLVQEWRKENQPGALRNLGTTSLLARTRNTSLGFMLRGLASVFQFLVPKSKRIAFKVRLMMAFMGKPILSKYLFGLNRYMWMDTASHQYFSDYVKVINKLYVKPRLEIEVW